MTSAILLIGTLLSVNAPPDRVGYLDNGRIRLGVDLDLGGAITYLSRSGSDKNVVNSEDWGREIQMSHYSGPVPFVPHGKQPNATWAGLGWNPIQSGDAFGNRSKVVEYRNDGRSIFIKCIPMQWPLNNEPGECTYECTIRLDGQAVDVAARVRNARLDRTQYEGRGQELPAIYTNGPWYRLVTYTGGKPFTGDKLSQQPAVFPWTGWTATENWTALLDDDDFGLGIWEPGVFSMIGGFSGNPGAGGPKDGQTGYIAPVLNEILDYNIDYRYRYALYLGTLDEIRRFVYRQKHADSSPDYRFSGSRQHWIYHGASDTGWPIRGQLDITLFQPAAELVGPDGFWAADSGKTVTIDAAFDSTCQSVSLGWKTYDDPKFSDEKQVAVPIVADGLFHRLSVDLSSQEAYRGAITGVRLIVNAKPRAAARLRVKEIRLGR